MWNVSEPMADLLFAASNWLLILGALAIFVGTIGAFTMSAAREYFAKERALANEAEVARAGATAESAKAAAAIANEAAAKANERAAQANLAAESERIERLKLEEKLAPRSFSLQEKTQLVARLKPFSSEPIDIVVFPVGSPDIAPLAEKIERILSESGWIVRTWTDLSGKQLSGASIAIRDGSNASARLAAGALIDGLNAAGISTNLASDLTTDDFPMPAVGPAPVGKIAPIRLFIGSKP